MDFRSSVLISLLFLPLLHSRGLTISHVIKLHTVEQTEPYPAIFVNEGDNITIECDKLDHQHVQLIRIFSNGTSSPIKDDYALTFRSPEFNGELFSCTAQSAQTQEQMIGYVRVLSFINKGYYGRWETCNHKKECYNKAQCYVDPEHAEISLCVCTFGFYGESCQLTFEGWRAKPNIRVHSVLEGYIHKSHFWLSLAIFGIVTAALIALSGFVYYKCRNERQEKIIAIRQLSQFRKNQLLETQESLQAAPKKQGPQAAPLISNEQL